MWLSLSSFFLLFFFLLSECSDAIFLRLTPAPLVHHQTETQTDLSTASDTLAATCGELQQTREDLATTTAELSEVKRTSTQTRDTLAATNEELLQTREELAVAVGKLQKFKQITGENVANLTKDLVSEWVGE